MSYIDIADLAEAASFRTRIKVAIVRAAANVINENTAQFTTARADKRRALAANILADPSSWANRWVWPIIANTTIANQGLAAPDSDLDYQVGVMWDAIAGVNVVEMQAP